MEKESNHHDRDNSRTKGLSESGAEKVRGLPQKMESGWLHPCKQTSELFSGSKEVSCLRRGIEK